MYNSNLPEVKREGIFIKIKNWFRRIFKESKSKETTDIDIDKYEQEIRNEFKNNIQVKDENAVILMRKFEANKINISDLTDIELDKLIALYKEKISEKKERLKLTKVNL
ncbi:MAG: hypothetical protein J5881_00630 [Clostridia bacterium]|nr:hypothetical protein [Clostridia bacterium]